MLSRILRYIKACYKGRLRYEYKPGLWIEGPAKWKVPRVYRVLPGGGLMSCNLDNPNLKGLSDRDDVVLAQYTAGPDYNLICDEIQEIDAFIRKQYGAEIVSVGTSAGGSAALVSAIRDGAGDMVLFYPQVDFTKIDSRLSVMIKAADNLGWNPADKLSGLNVKAYHGTKDSLVSPDNSKLFKDHTLVEAGHSFPINSFL